MLPRSEEKNTTPPAKKLKVDPEKEKDIKPQSESLIDAWFNSPIDVCYIVADFLGFCPVSNKVADFEDDGCTWNIAKAMSSDKFLVAAGQDIKVYTKKGELVFAVSDHLPAIYGTKLVSINMRNPRIFDVLGDLMLVAKYVIKQETPRMYGYTNSMLLMDTGPKFRLMEISCAQPYPLQDAVFWKPGFIIIAVETKIIAKRYSLETGIPENTETPLGEFEICRCKHDVLKLGYFQGVILAVLSDFSTVRVKDSKIETLFAGNVLETYFKGDCRLFRHKFYFEHNNEYCIFGGYRVGYWMFNPVIAKPSIQCVFAEGIPVFLPRNRIARIANIQYLKFGIQLPPISICNRPTIQINQLKRGKLDKEFQQRIIIPDAEVGVLISIGNCLFHKHSELSIFTN